MKGGELGRERPDTANSVQRGGGGRNSARLAVVWLQKVLTAGRPFGEAGEKGTQAGKTRVGNAAQAARPAGVLEEPGYCCCLSSDIDCTE